MKKSDLINIMREVNNTGLHFGVLCVIKNNDRLVTFRTLLLHTKELIEESEKYETILDDDCNFLNEENLQAVAYVCSSYNIFWNQIDKCKLNYVERKNNG